MLQEEILQFIGNISPQARDYVQSSFENIEVLYSLITDKNSGVFIKVNSEECCIFYASFLNEDNIEDALGIIKNKTNEYLSKIDSKEVCFNVYGNNLKIINLIRDLGFKLDIEGYYLEYGNKEIPQLKNSNLTVKGFERSMLKEYVHLFDGAYYQLNIDNHWEINSYAKNEEQFHEKLNTLNKHNQVYSFWIDKELIGAYILKENYIMDFVVNPIYQNKGYGSYMLAHCVKNMKENKAIKKVRLGVVKTNTAAKRFYERNGFVEISCYSEHTYR